LTNFEKSIKKITKLREFFTEGFYKSDWEGCI